MLSGNTPAQFVAAARERAGLSQRKLSLLAGYSTGWANLVEAGKRPIPDAALPVLAQCLRLSSWETQYLYALRGKVTGSKLAPQNVDLYLDALHPHPAAYLSPGWTVRHANPEFERLFKGLWVAPNWLTWHFMGRQAPDIMVDWQASADWVISWVKFNLAVEPDEPDLVKVLDKMRPVTEFARQWDRNVIPADPASLPWTVYDIDNDVVKLFDMRVWRPGQSSDFMLLGVTRETADA